MINTTDTISLLGYAIMGILMGLIVIKVLWTLYNNQNASICALMSGCMGSLVFFSPVLYSTLVPSYLALSRMGYTQWFMECIAIAGIIYGFLASATYYYIGKNTNTSQHYTTVFWCFIIFILSSILLGLTSYNLLEANRIYF